MKKITIIAAGEHAEIMKTVLRLINNNPDWEGEIALSIEELGEKLSNNSYDLILLGAGIDEVRLRALLHDLRLEIPVVLHYGGGSGLLLSEIQQVIDRKLI
ncbi:hypothetical protein [Arcticibacter eurypsychrophilus]|uniref:hypothetical protein n=1 Tax=Arcticibacter eurypsychrophilus TaxID=1434752 RepID=UPI00084DA55E|nr:hypothetical protein [Arcticibacter eurypsychrophilus]